MKGCDGRTRARSSYSPISTRGSADADPTDAHLQGVALGAPGRCTQSCGRVTYVVGSEGQEILLETAGLAMESGRRIPDGIDTRSNVSTVATG